MNQYTSDQNIVARSYHETIRNKAWLEARSLSFKARFRLFPFKTIRYAVCDRFWAAVNRLKRRQVMPMHTFWGKNILMLFPNYRAVLYHGIIDGHELPIEEYFVGHICPGDIFFDIGANVGFYSLLARDMGASVHSFEPTPSTFKILSQNVSQGAALVNKALSDSSGTVQFQDKGVANGTNTMMFGSSQEGLINVETVDLDIYCQSVGVYPTIIKIDAEGADLKVIQGGLKTLAKYHPTIVLETINEELIRTLQGIGYSMEDIGGKAPSKFVCRAFTKAK